MPRATQSAVQSIMRASGTRGSPNSRIDSDDVDQPRVGRLRALEDGLLAEALAELLREPAHAGRRAADVERA